MRLCDRCESQIDESRPGHAGRGRRYYLHDRCPEFQGEMVSVGGFAEVFEVDGVPRIVYADAEKFVALNDTERQDLQDAIEDHYERRVSFGSWRRQAASWVVPSPTEFNGFVWVCRTDGWAPELEE